MTRYLLLFSSVFSVFAMSWVLGRTLEPANCMNSTLVRKVVKEDGSNLVSQCDLLVRLFDPPIPREVSQLGLVPRLERLEIVRPFLKAELAAIKVVLTAQKDQLDLSGSVIKIGEAAIRQPDLLERAIILSQLEQQSPLSSDVVADFLWRRAQGLPRQAELPWFREVRSLVQYCRSGDYLAIHNEFCSAHNELSDGLITDGGEGISAWSVKPLLLGFLETLYFEADLRTKAKILDNVIFLGEPDDTTIEQLQNARSLPRAEAQVIKLLSDWALPLGLERFATAAVLKNLMFSKNPIDQLIVVARSARDIFPLGGDGVRFEREIPTSAIQFGRKTYFFPSDVAFEASSSESILTLKPGRIVYVACEIPSPRTLLSFQRDVRRITFVRYCNPEDVDWIEFSRLGADQYLANNQTAEFIDFDLPALVFAEKIRGPLENSGDFHKWQSWLMWQGLMPDESPFAQRPLAVIEGVKRFRLY